jgi:ubiquinone/menaquinone biosynthesis C-methylase UbiE
MIEKANANIQKSGLMNAEIVQGNAESVPLPDAMFDVVTSNGVINLVPDKTAVFSEVQRVLKPGGRLQVSDIVLARALSEKSRSNPQLWAECIVGAVPEDTYLEIVRSAGFVDVRVIDRVDYFDRSASQSTKNAARQYGAGAITLVARKS